MGIDKNAFISKSGEYETPNEIVEPLKKEFNLELDVCATKENAKCELFFTKEDNAFSKEWDKNFWMNPPFSKDLRKWVQRAYEQSLKHKVIGVLILPVRSNTNWWHKYILDTKAEVRFLKGEIKFSGMDRGLWLPFTIIIFKPSKIKEKNKMAEKYKCVGCGEYKNDEPYGLCKECEKDHNRQVSEFEEEYGTAKELEE